MNRLFIKNIKLNRENIDISEYPFNIKCLKNFDELKLENPVTFLYGENGVGKSTFLEALAIGLGVNPEGGTDLMQFSNYDDYSELHEHLTIGKFSKPKVTFFLRAESFYNVASYINEIGAEVKAVYGDLHEVSHGESFLQLVENKFKDKGLYILDEPESALSPQRQLTLLYHINRLAKAGSQFIIATHSPILLAYKYGKIFDLNNDIKEIKYDDTEVYQTYKLFLQNPDRMQELLFEEK